MKDAAKRFTVNAKDARKTTIVRIEWLDACAYAGRFRIDGSDTDWSDVDWHGDDGSLLVRSVTVGFLVRQSARAVTVCTTLALGSARVADLMTIPRAWIAKITRLRGK